MSVQPLFTPVRMGELDLPNRIVMAPLTRMRAGPIDHVPTALQAEYYAQRASVGLIVPEATAISPPTTSCGKVEDNHPDRAAYLGQGWTAYAALTRGLAVHPRDAVFVSSGGELPRNFVDGPMIWKGI
jgi:2,4-dienoyl-CoA reductase-like NADH-dependent reductase (Old Yellow Enzyme family)